MPFDQGIVEIPSGCLPSDLHSPAGSKRDGTPAEIRAWQIMLFTAACRGKLLLLLWTRTRHSKTTTTSSRKRKDKRRINSNNNNRNNNNDKPKKEVVTKIVK